MEANRVRRRWTYAEYARLPSEESARYEVIDGELIMTPSPRPSHQRIVTDLAEILNAFVRTRGLGQVFAGPVDVIFAEGDYLAPDIVFVKQDRAALVSDRGIEGPPDLVVEALSPSTEKRDRGIKLDRYRLFGVAEYWMIDPDRRVAEVWHLAEGASEPVTLGTADTLRWTPSESGPSLAIDLSELFGSAQT